MEAFQDFRTKFKALSDTEKKVLKVLTILYEPINQTLCVQLFKKCDISTEKGTHFYPKDIRELKNSLAKSDWLGDDIMSRLVVNPVYAEYIMRLAILDDNYIFWVKQIREIKTYKVYFSPVSFEATVRELRLAIYQADLTLFAETKRNLETYYVQKWDVFEFVDKVFLPFDARWFATYKTEIQLFAIQYLANGKMFELESLGDLKQFMEESEMLTSKNTDGSQIRALLNLLYGFQGKTEEMARVLNLENNELSSFQRIGWLQFLFGKYDEAITSFEKGMKLMRKETGNRNAHFPNINGVFHVLSILAQRVPNYLKIIQTYYHQTYQISSFEPSFNYLRATAYFQLNKMDEMRAIMDIPPDNPYDMLIWAMAKYWNQQEISGKNLGELELYYQKAKENGYNWMAMEYAGVLSHLSTSDSLRKKYDKEWLDLQKELGLKSMLNIVPIVEKWERSLEALLNIKTKKKRSKAGGDDGK